MFMRLECVKVSFSCEREQTACNLRLEQIVVREPNITTQDNIVHARVDLEEENGQQKEREFSPGHTV
jgi:hypothetical protein